MGVADPLAKGGVFHFRRGRFLLLFNQIWGRFFKCIVFFIANLGALAAIFEAPLSILAQIWGRCFYLGAPCPLPFHENMALEGRGSLVGKSKAREGAWVGQVRGRGT